MSQIDKLIARLKNKPKDFTYAELARIMKYFGYVEETGDGSRRRFVDKDGNTFTMHEPHNPPRLMPYQVKEVIGHLEGRELI